MTPVYLALGGNLGSVEQSFELAARELAHLPQTRVIRTSSVFRFPAVGRHAGSEFTNAAAAIETSLEPLELLAALQKIENDFGRKRDVRWGPRPLDLDIVFIGDQIIEHPRLRVPHPACWYRRFVLDPLAEIAPDVIHPQKGISVAELQARLLVRPLTVAFAGGTELQRTQLVSELFMEFPDVEFSTQWPANVKSKLTGNEPTLVIWLGRDDGSQSGGFSRLPPVPRLDSSGLQTAPGEFLRDVLHSALGC